MLSYGIVNDFADCYCLQSTPIANGDKQYPFVKIPKCYNRLVVLLPLENSILFGAFDELTGSNSQDVYIL